jgi:hypothetical protein
MKTGSTIMWKMLRDCSNVAAMELDEGEKYWCQYPHYLHPWAPVTGCHGLPTRNVGLYESESRYPWDRIKEVWNTAWDKKNDDRLYVEKSPPNVFRWEMLDREFENCFFIAILRNPYSWIESMIDHFGSKDKIMAAEHFVTDWVTYTLRVKQAKEALGDRMLITQYENLDGLLDFAEIVPEISEIKLDTLVNNTYTRIEHMTLARLKIISKTFLGDCKSYRHVASLQQMQEALLFSKYGLLNTEYGTDKRVLPVSQKWTGDYLLKYEKFRNDRFTDWTNNGMPEWMLNLGIYDKVLVDIVESC